MPFPLYTTVMASVVGVSLLIGLTVVSNESLPIALDTATNSTASAPEAVFTNSTHLAQVCVEQCGVGGVCEQDVHSAYTTCVVCGPGTSLDPASGRCRNTLECDTWPWCSGAEADPLIEAHSALVLTAWTGPGPNNFTYPATNLTAMLPFVPYIAATSTDALALLNQYLTGRRTLGPAYGAMTYFDDSVGVWGTSLAVYKSIVPSVWVDYVLALKTRCCTRTWQALNGTCLPPTLP